MRIINLHKQRKRHVYTGHVRSADDASSPTGFLVGFPLHSASSDTSTGSGRWAPNQCLADWLCSNITRTHKHNFLLPKYGAICSKERQANALQMTKGLFSFTSPYGIGETNHRLSTATVRLWTLYDYDVNSSTADICWYCKLKITGHTKKNK